MQAELTLLLQNFGLVDRRRSAVRPLLLVVRLLGIAQRSGTPHWCDDLCTDGLVRLFRFTGEYYLHGTLHLSRGGQRCVNRAYGLLQLGLMKRRLIIKGCRDCQALGPQFVTVISTGRVV